MSVSLHIPTSMKESEFYEWIERVYKFQQDKKMCD